MIQNFTRRHGNQLCTSGNLGDKIYIEHIADYVSVFHQSVFQRPILFTLKKTFQFEILFGTMSNIQKL